MRMRSETCLKKEAKMASTSKDLMAKKMISGLTSERERRPRLGRRQFLRAGAVVGLSVASAGAWSPSLTFAADADEEVETPDMQLGADELIVQPVLLYGFPRRLGAGGWRNWGGVQNEQDVQQETARINGELKQLSESASFKLRLLPLAKVSKQEQVGALKDGKADVVLVYGAGGGPVLLKAVASIGKWTVLFVRHRSGPFYFWTEVAHSMYLRGHTDEIQRPDLDVNDVVVDDINDVLWRLCSLYGLKNTIGRRIVCIGRPGGWGGHDGPKLARERFQLDMVNVSIPEIKSMVQTGRRNEPLMADCRKKAKEYFTAGGVTLNATEESVVDAFLLKKLFRDLMEKSNAFAITTNLCWATYAGIIPCLTLTMTNDSGYMAYCEGDFVVIPAHILTHFVSAKPTYFCNPTLPHRGRMMFAHCTAPRRMDGKTLEPVDLVTHYESDYGVATHVHFRKGQVLTIVKPDFQAKNWLALTGNIVDTPIMDTCRAQVDVELRADTQQVLKNLRGFHCVLVYGDHTREIAYAAKKVGITVQTLPG